LPIEVIGSYEPRGHEPVALYVEGSFKILRYSNPKEAVTAAGTGATNITGIGTDQNNQNNGIGQWGGATDNAGLSKHIRPAELLISTTSDIEVYNGTTTEETKILFKIHGARIIRASGSISKKEIVEESFTFKALMFSDNSFNASASSAWKATTSS
jgi:hypothetical protein